tara:strand:- start:1760 stop:2959 length:1200 start_codon:yes stop_codon:yes gene_type:complete
MNRAISKAVFAATAAGITLGVQAEPLSALSAAVTTGDINLNLRVRYEAVEQDNLLEDADALTIRTLLGYTTQKWNELTAFVEMENVSALMDDYSSTPPPTRYSLVPDPDETETNQWGLRFTGIQNLVATLGRSRLVLDNARWVGNVGWRQNEQTYDGVFLKFTPRKSLTAQYAYLSNINNIFSSNVDIDAHLINVQWTVSPLLTLTGYGYLLDFENTTANSPDADTLGLRLTGGHEFSNGIGMSYVAEFASQEAETPAGGFDADYSLLELAASFKGTKLALAQEVLGSDQGQYAVMTPLATLHAFNGWSDQFLFTPAQGLVDNFVTLSGSLGKTKWLAVYHEYESDQSGLDYGTEWGVVVSRPLPGNLLGGIKYSAYEAEDRPTDTDKLWVWLQWGFGG